METVILSGDNEDVDLYKPEHWLGSPKKSAAGGEGVEADLVFNPQAGPGILFGVGNRGRFERRLAYVEFEILLTMVVENYELLRYPGELSSYTRRLAFVWGPGGCFLRLRKVFR
ncbi:hypothetical protein F5B18DRAFT_672061 [Nemania serpens]|nr:hypothetical protein F5B18DRAFT_672061 [Nemania serpens]